jgi:hypothetical protein
LIAVVLACGDAAGPEPVPLEILAIDPLNGAVDVARTENVVITWSRPIAPATAATGLIVAKDSVDLPATGSTQVDGAGTHLTFRPEGGFGFNQWIRVLAPASPSGVSDPTGSGLAEPFEAFFRTSSAPPVEHADALGDTLATDTLFAERAADLLRLDVSHGPDIVSLTLTFGGPRVLDDPDSSDYVTGFIDLDTDHNPNTGVEPWVDFLLRVNGFPPLTGMREDYYVDFFEPRDGVALLARWVTSDSSELAAVLTPTVAGNSIRFDLPIAALGRTGGNLQVATFVATKTFVTDFLPDSGHVTFGHPGGSAAQLRARVAAAGRLATRPGARFIPRRVQR